MNGQLYIEVRPDSMRTSLSWYIAHHLYARPVQGKLFVVAEDPPTLLSAVSKQWQRIVRQVQRERSSTLNTTRIRALTQKLTGMQKLRLTAKTPEEEPNATVFFATTPALLDNPPNCHTIYVTYTLDAAVRAMITSRMMRHGLVVICS